MAIEHLLKKKSLFIQIYDITKATVFTGGEEDALTYAALIENRERLFNEIKSLDKKIPETPRGTDAERALSDIRNTVRGIVELDKKNEADVTRILNSLKKSLREIKEGKNASNKYSEYLTNDGVYFDKKN